MNILIVGYGSAGKRHLKTLSELGYKNFGIVDILVSNLNLITNEEEIIDNKEPLIFYNNLDDAFEDKSWDIAIIATPPEYHLEQVEKCLDKNLWILCEKPLCAFGQLKQARKLLMHPNKKQLMIAFNYRFGTKNWLKNIDGDTIGSYTFEAQQYREKIPYWGLLLDHLPHEIDLFYWLTGNMPTIKSVSYINAPQKEQYTIYGTIGRLSLFITETVTKMPTERRAIMTDPYGITYDISANPEMFTLMWEAFFVNIKNSNPQSPGLSDGYMNQIILEKIKQLENI